MDVGQMLAHLNVSLETPLRRNFPKRAFLGRLIGGLVKIGHLSKKPLPKIAPTDPSYVINHQPDFEEDKCKSIELIKTFYENGPDKCSECPHSFFGQHTPA